jgi:hypothetical protein
MKTILMLVSFMAALVSFNILAIASGLEPKTENGVTYISGGVGGGEQETLRAMEGNYNLRLTFAARQNGEYLSDIKVTILGSKGDRILQTVSNGPLFYAQLKPGTYKVVMDHDGKVTTRSVHITSSRPITETVAWSNVRNAVDCC